MLAVTATGLTWAAAMTATAEVGDGPRFHYFYNKEPIPLALTTERVAVFHNDAAAGRLEAVVEVIAPLAAHGIEANDVQPHTIRTIFTAAAPVDLRDESSIRALVASLAMEADLDFVSPIFADERGDPVMMSPHLHIGFEAGVSREDAEALIAIEVGGAIEEADWGGMTGVYRIRTDLKDGFDVLALANALAVLPEVTFAEPDMVMTVRKDLIPNDTHFGLLWGLHNTGQSGGTVDMDMNGPEAWDITTGDPSVIVLILDDGVEQSHADINQISGADFTGNGTSGGPFNSCDNHGTTVAGCSSAIINNGQGIAGIAPGCMVASAKWNVSNVPCNGGGTFFSSWLVNAINSSITIEARVTNNSNGFGNISSVTTAYNNTFNSGVIHFAATGNSGGGSISYPSSIANVNAVGAINRNGNRASFSQFGAGIAFMAPGESIVVTDRTGAPGFSGGTYLFVSGTSYSSPYAAGVAAMVLSVNNALTSTEVQNIMNSTAMDRGAAGYDTTYGWGILRADDAMNAALPPCLANGDLDLSTVIDGDDAVLFIECLISGTGTNCGCGDFNASGGVESGDIPGMLTALGV
ncbi:MAG: S8 family serine peptidase [Phycisphaerae bacterium]